MLQDISGLLSLPDDPLCEAQLALPLEAMHRKDLGKSCHNCRRRRLKCDRAIPGCRKCLHRGEECLGYGTLFRWEQGLASRGKMVGKTFQAAMQGASTSETPPRSRLHSYVHISLSMTLLLTRSLRRSLQEPILHSMDASSNRYFYYCMLPIYQPLAASWYTANVL